LTKPSALIFDVDGTLADTERNGHRVAFNRAFADAGLDWNWDEEFYGELLSVPGGKERIGYFITVHAPRLPALAEDLKGWVARLHEAKGRHYRRLLASGKVRPRIGIKRLIMEASQAGIRLAIATTSQPDSVRALLAGAFAPIGEDWFEVIAAGDRVPRKKPAPDVYRFILDRMNLPPSECLAIEDSRQGLEAALAAAIPTVVTVNPYTAAQDFTGAVAVLDHLGDPDCPLQGAERDGPAWVDVDQLRRWSELAEAR
jgi:HAD superfamily hydrolase (TIGR01509 family)